MSSKKIALVTGANKGIGLETARQLGQEGITVLVGARDDAKARQAAEKLQKDGIDAHALLVDVNDGAAIGDADPAGQGQMLPEDRDLRDHPFDEGLEPAIRFSNATSKQRGGTLFPPALSSKAKGRNSSSPARTREAKRSF